MSVKKCPNCGEETFFKTPTGRKCTKCDYEMIVPANKGKGGKGCKCSHCGKFRVFDGVCRECGAEYTSAD